MTALHAMVALVAAQRLSELVVARRNTRALLARGAHEVGAGHYPLFVALHASWLASLLVLVPADAPPRWPLLGAYGVLMAARLWVMASLGRFWTTRIITLPGAPLVRSGPYRWLSHPNYAVVALEMAVLPLAFDAWGPALSFSVLNAALLAHRIRVEEAALSARGRPGAAS